MKFNCKYSWQVSLIACAFVVLLNGCATSSIQRVVIYRDAETIGTKLFQSINAFDKEASSRSALANTGLKNFGNILSKSLQHVRLEDGYCFDYYYRSNKFQSRPFLYTRTKNELPYSYEDLIKRKSYLLPEKATPAYFRRIILDGSNEAFLELFYLWTVGESWGLGGHASRQSVCLLFNQDEFMKTINLVEGGKAIATSDYANQIDITPVMVEHNGMITIQTYQEEWEGITKTLWTIINKPPYSVVEIKREVIIENQKHKDLWM